MEQRRLTGPLDPSLVGAASSWLQSLGAEFNFLHEDLYRIDMCFEELVSNVVNYSDPRFANQPVNLYARIEAQRATLTLIDPASAFDPFSRPPPTVAKNVAEFEIGGQGVHLVREFSDAHRYERRDNTNRVELVFELAQPTKSSPLFSRIRCNATGWPDLGFISWTQIFQDGPHAAIEGLLERLPIQDIVGELILLRPGDTNNAVRVVLQGRLKVYLDQPGGGDFIEVGVGACFGEISVINHRSVSAYVMAEPGTQLLVIDEDSFLNEIMKIPLGGTQPDVTPVRTDAA